MNLKFFIFFSNIVSTFNSIQFYFALTRIKNTLKHVQVIQETIHHGSDRTRLEYTFKAFVLLYI